MKITHKRKIIFNGSTLKDLNTFIHSSNYSNLKNIKQLDTYDTGILSSNITYTLINFIKTIPKFKTNVPGTINYWLERGWKHDEASFQITKHKEAQSKGQLTKIPEAKRKIIAKKASKKRIEQIKNLQKNGKYNRSNPTSIEYYLAKGMNRTEAEKALKKRQSTFSKKKMIEKYGEEKGLKRVEERNNKWITSLKENNDWYEKWLDKIKPTLENFIKRHGERGIEKYNSFVEKRNVKNGSVSKESITFFDEIVYQIKDFIPVNEIYIAKNNNKEYWLNYNNGQNKYYYDLTIRNLNIIVEYHGTHVHPNPKWKKDKWDLWSHPWNKKSASEIRKLDKQKKSLAENQGFTVLEIWNDEDYVSNQQKVLNFIFKKLT